MVSYNFPRAILKEDTFAILHKLDLHLTDLTFSWAHGILIQGKRHEIASIWLFKLLHKFISQHWRPEEGKQTTNMLVWYRRSLCRPTQQQTRPKKKKKL